MFTRKSRSVFVMLLIALVAPITKAQRSLNNAQRTTPSSATSKRMNVLFIAVDDLRPPPLSESSHRSRSVIQTPNIDALASRGTTFTRAYCQQAVCSPSRTSLLTGRRPDTTKIYDLQTHFRLHLPDVITLPQHFKQQGYHTQSLSKIYHPGLDDPQSWSVPSWQPGGDEYTNPATLAQLQKEQEVFQAARKQAGPPARERDPKTGLILRTANQASGPRGPSWEAADVPDSKLKDGQTAAKAIAALREAKDKLFFLAVGFRKPHLPFVAPKRYFDLYPPEKIRLAANTSAPQDAPTLATTNFGELRAYSDIPKGNAPIPDAKARELVRAYYAAASYTDAQIGRVIDELDRLGLREQTIIVLWGDHGWHLGEHGLWCKHTNFDVATRSPLIVSAPQQPHKGRATKALVEFVDIYPTLCELAGLPVPADLEGISMTPVMLDPERAWKRAAFSQYPRAGGVMGYSMRTDRYRYTEWIKKGEDDGKEVVGVELYDHLRDRDENVNVAGRAEHKRLVAELSEMLRGGWRAALPVDYPVGKLRQAK